MLFIESKKDSFFVSNGNSNEERNITLDKLINNGILSAEGYLIIKQDDHGNDTEDRIEKAVTFIKNIEHLTRVKNSNL